MSKKKKKKLIPIHFQHFNIIFIICMSIFGLDKMLMCTCFEEMEKYMFFTLVKTDSFGQPHTKFCIQFSIACITDIDC